MVGDWDRRSQEHPGARTVMVTDASNVELDRINALAQERRAQAGELGADRVELPDRPYGLAAGDQVIFTAPSSSRAQQRVENGTLGDGHEHAGEAEIDVQTRGATSARSGRHRRVQATCASHTPSTCTRPRAYRRSRVRADGRLADRPRARLRRAHAAHGADRHLRLPRGSRRAGHGRGRDRTPRRAMAESHAQQPSIATPPAERDPTHGVDAVRGDRTGGTERAGARCRRYLPTPRRHRADKGA